MRPAPAGRRPVSNGKEDMDVFGFRRPVRRLRATRQLLGICALAIAVAGVGASSAAAMSPPEEDSETATVCCRSFKRAANSCARGKSSCMSWLRAGLSASGDSTTKDTKDTKEI